MGRTATTGSSDYSLNSDDKVIYIYISRLNERATSHSEFMSFISTLIHAFYDS